MSHSKSPIKEPKKALKKTIAIKKPESLKSENKKPEPIFVKRYPIK